ncbi:lysozyme inhibitor LprI family protein [Undibacterium sp. TC4M20W]|uniref:lysozyme inhibitor LprI family protein n=1 Tax=Undibacterium sp. TC4M20W TaxID=3413052 RepID=UPI003BF1859F
MKSIQSILACLLCATATVSHAGILCATAKNTQEEAQCMTAEVSKADKKLQTYLQAAKSRIDRTPDVKLNLDNAQKSWEQYRSAHCGDVYTYWAQGSVRYRQSAQCQLDLTQNRTHDVWQAYLTYADSTPPVLPRP